MKILTIAIDVDDVLSAGADALVAYSNKKWGTNLKVSDYDENWAAMWQVDRATAVKRFDQIAEERLFKSHQTLPEARTVLKKLATRFNLVVATSRSTDFVADTAEWIDQNFPGIFSNIHHSGIYDSGHHFPYSLTKADLIDRIEANYLIDDQLKHCIGVAERGVKALLFGDYGWNQLDPMPEGIARVADWSAVLEYFDVV